MALTPPPAAPQRGDRATFAQRVDAFITWLIGFVAELNIFSANLNSIAAGGAYAIPYLFSTDSSNIGKGGYFTFPSPNTTANLYLDSFDARGASVSAALVAIMNSTSAIKAQIKVTALGDPSRFFVREITFYANNGTYGSSSSNGVSGSASSLAEGEEVIVQIQRTGDKGDTGVMGVLPRAKFREQRASGTSAGIAVNGANTRDLNTTEFNSISGASLASSSVTLPPGTYDFGGWAMRYSSGSGGGGHKAYLHNVTDNTTVSFGSSGSIGTLAINDRSVVSGRFTIAAAKTFQLRHFIEATSGSGSSLGFASSSGFAEVYSEIEFLKVA